VQKILILVVGLAVPASIQAQTSTDTVAVLSLAIDTVANLHFDLAQASVDINSIYLQDPARGIHVSPPASAAVASRVSLPMRRVPREEYDCFRPRPGTRRVCRTVGADGMLLPNLRSISSDRALVYVSYDRNVVEDDGTQSARLGTRTVELRRGHGGWVVTNVGALVTD
jgi:hypothetical protein